ncbi:hypothetical protein ASPZODRAFT_141755 [Penicilliopsis zonata CBS 506.65]|uniref:Major facilitator superfamily (MFS) profile domain-containing protein n=1 Tax=Penicilliopsis zonata CBS 506.65 TaxID=1073090 RepID=A0A1L9SIE7_9EURO|nr:hypothetical protein ASPZODRAFT_141755 [Penicilliopsis zonata CBS 506.65]OJJ46985.1 hypothetical protein ASPZODRAFT_141755 [Penicilliopsis zonata CBS 506.65]
MVAAESYEGPEKLRGNEESVAVSIDEATVADWTEEEENRVRRKIDFILLPILGLAFFALQMDRGNISNALTSTITEDLGVTTDQINNGNSLLSMGIVLLEIPSNLLLQKIGARNWLTFQIIAWGLVATLQNFITNYASYIVTRLLLGFLEAGFIPEGALYTMSTWYKKSETSLRVSIFFLGNLLASATVSLIGAGILSMSGRYGVSGWRWLFIIEGIITVGVGLIFMLFLPQSVSNSSPLISGGKWSYFSSREHYILVRRTLLDDPAKSKGQVRISRRDITSTLSNPRILLHVFITLACTISVSAVQTYAPSIVKSIGFGAVQANALVSVGSYIAAIVVLVLGWICDKTGRRGPSATFAALWCVIAYVCLLESVHFSKWKRYAAIVAATATNSTVHIINVGWLSVNCQSPQERSISMCMVIMAANAGGIAGGQVFRTSDAPLYIHAFTAMLALASAGLVAVLGQMAWYFSSNRRLAKSGKTHTVTTHSNGAEITATWWWTW